MPITAISIPAADCVLLLHPLVIGIIVLSKMFSLKQLINYYGDYS